MSRGRIPCYVSGFLRSPEYYGFCLLLASRVFSQRSLPFQDQGEFFPGKAGSLL